MTGLGLSLGLSGGARMPKYGENLLPEGDFVDPTKWTAQGGNSFTIASGQIALVRDTGNGEVVATSDSNVTFENGATYEIIVTTVTVTTNRNTALYAGGTSLLLADNIVGQKRELFVPTSDFTSSISLRIRGPAPSTQYTSDVSEVSIRKVL